MLLQYIICEMWNMNSVYVSRLAAEIVGCQTQVESLYNGLLRFGSIVLSTLYLQRTHCSMSFI